MMATSLPTSSALGPIITKRALEGAISEFQSVLTADELRELHKIKSVPDADAVLVFTAQLDYRNRQRTGPSIASRLYNVLQSVRDFCGVVDVFVSSHPEIAALVWGSVKLTMLIVLNFTSCYEALSKLFLDLGKICPIFRDYSALYPTSKELQQSLSKFHASIIRCCKHVIEFVRRPWHGQVFALFANEFKPDVDKIHEESQNVRDYLALAKAEADLQAQRLQDLDRKEAEQSRYNMAAFFSRTNRDLDETTAWRLRSEEQQARERRQEVLDALSTHDYLMPLKQARRTRGSNTARWIFDTPEFGRWINGPSPLFWCSGKIGSGKTILATSVIDHLLTEKRHPKSVVSFFFVCFDNQSSLDAETIFRSILRQRLTTDFPREIETRLSMLNLSFKLPEIIDLLHTASVSDTHYIIIDGLDECEKASQRVLLEGLSLLASLNTGLKVFLSSRESLSGEVRKSFPSLEHVSMDCAALDLDIKTYIEDTINEKLDCEDLIVGDGNLLGEIKRALINGANGMFLWVVFQIQEICSQHCDEDIRKAIKNLPKDITETFERAINRIIRRGQKRPAEKIFQWVAGAKRPLNLDELREALAVEVGQQFSNPERYYNDLHKVTSWCENLIQVDEELQLVQFAHHTVLQFLQEKSPDSEFHLALKEVDHQIGELCITYLNFNDFRTTVSRRYKPLFPFGPIDIALTVLPHEGGTSKITHILHKAKQKLNSKPTTVEDIRRILNHGGSEGMEAARTQLESNHTFLHYASRYWISHTHDFEEGKSRTWPIFKNMIVYGHDLAMQPWVLDDYNAHDSAVLQWACKSRHYPLLKLFVERRDGLSATALSDVLNRCKNLGDHETLRFIFNYYVKESNLEHAFYMATRSGHSKIIHFLLLGGAHLYVIDSAASEELTTSQAAALGGHVDTVETLLGDYPNVINATTTSNRSTTKRVAALGGYLAIIERLTSAGANFNASTIIYRGRVVSNRGAGELKTMKLVITGPNINAGGDGQRDVANLLIEENSSSRYFQMGIWDITPGPPRSQHSKRINFTKPFDTTPEVITWLRSLEIQATYVEVHPSSVDKKGFTIYIESLGGSSHLYNASVNWFAHSTNNPAITSGHFSRDMRLLDSPVPETGTLYFKVALTRMPKLIVAINTLQYENSTDFRLHLSTSSVTPLGFTWHLKSLGSPMRMFGLSFLAWV